MLHVQLVDLVDQHQRFDCLSVEDVWLTRTTRTLTLYRDGERIGEQPGSSGDFDIPQPSGNYRLTYDLDASAVLPVSTRVNTAWTFRSTGPTGTGSVPIPLLSVDCALPLDAQNHANGNPAGFIIRQALGTPAQEITTFDVWSSTDNGTTWVAASVRRIGSGQYTAQLPQPTAGETVSLRVAATASGGSGIEQTIIQAYRAG